MILLETTVIMADGTLSHSAELVPGDRIRITNGKVPCDCILLHGQVIMNEALLTGESVPVIKEALASSTNLFDPQQCEKNLIFNGTSCLQSLDGEALVYQTGFLTMKGSLSRSILFSKNKSFSFKEDSAKYLLVMLTFGLLSLVGNIYITIHQGYSLKKAIIRGLEVITICVPPSLPAALGAGIQLAINRLDAQGISCIKPDKVNVGGIVNLCAFDKTGTLTESGLEIYGCKPSKDSGFGKRLRVDELSS
jgi:cation-transporting ATPase 13A3/4/5